MIYSLIPYEPPVTVGVSDARCQALGLFGAARTGKQRFEERGRIWSDGSGRQCSSGRAHLHFLHFSKRARRHSERAFVSQAARCLAAAVLSILVFGRSPARGEDVVIASQAVVACSKLTSHDVMEAQYSERQLTPVPGLHDSV